MKAYFSKHDNEFYLDNSFEYDGAHFENCVEFGSNPGGLDEFVISDATGRSIPLCIEDIDDLINILEHIKISSCQIDHYEQVINNILNDDYIVTYD